MRAEYASYAPWGCASEYSVAFDPPGMGRPGRHWSAGKEWAGALAMEWAGALAMQSRKILTATARLSCRPKRSTNQSRNRSHMLRIGVPTNARKAAKRTMRGMSNSPGELPSSICAIESLREDNNSTETPFIIIGLFCSIASKPCASARHMDVGRGEFS